MTLPKQDATNLPPCLEVIDGETLQLTLADGESDEALLLRTDLEQEAAYQKAAGFTLSLN